MIDPHRSDYGQAPLRITRVRRWNEVRGDRSREEPPEKRVGTRAGRARCSGGYVLRTFPLPSRRQSVACPPVSRHPATDRNADAIAAAVRKLIEDLERPLSEEDRRDGWTDQGRIQWLRHFRALENRLLRHEPPQGEQYHLMRWLNFDGIGLGPLADRCREVQRLLHDVYADEPRFEGTTGRSAKKLLRQLGLRPRSRCFRRDS